MYLRCVRACVVSLRECVPFVVCGVCVAGQAAGEGARQMAWMEGLGGPNGKQAGGPCRERARGSRANRGADSDCWRPAECRASVLDPLARAQPQCECARCVGMGADCGGRRRGAVRRGRERVCAVWLSVRRGTARGGRAIAYCYDSVFVSRRKKARARVFFIFAAPQRERRPP